MKKLCIVLGCLFCLSFNAATGYCFLDKFIKKWSPEGAFDRGSAAYDSSDYEAAIKEWKPLAEEGNIAAQYNLALAYKKKYNYKEAAYWYTQAAKKNYVEAQFSLGVLYEENEFDTYSPGLTKNNRTAAYWYTQSAQQGHAASQFFLGTLYEGGQGVLEDLEKARQLYTNAAYQGFGLAQEKLGYMFYNGDGGAKDAIQAYAWWSLYISQNPKYEDNQYVKERLQHLIDVGIYMGEKTSKIRFTMAKDYKKMTTEEINKAKELTQQRYNKIYGKLNPDN